MKCYIIKDKEEIENKKIRGKSIDNVQDMKCRINKKLRYLLIFFQEFRILRKVLFESKLFNLVYNFFVKNKKYVKKGLKRFRFFYFRLIEIDCVVFLVLDLQSGWDWIILDMKKEWFRFNFFVSLIYRRFYKLLFVLLVIVGFYYSVEYRKIQCFICDKCYILEYLENLLQVYGILYLLKGLYENWCLIFDYGNIFI